MKRSAVGQGSWLDVGLDRDAHIPQVRRWASSNNPLCCLSRPMRGNDFGLSPRPAGEGLRLHCRLMMQGPQAAGWGRVLPLRCKAASRGAAAVPRPAPRWAQPSCRCLLLRPLTLLQAAKQGVRLTLAMGEQPAVVTVQGQQVLQAALALPSGEHPRSSWLGWLAAHHAPGPAAAWPALHACRRCRAAAHSPHAR